jgi:alpha-beta hydrolase superfamily lysophospholipase
VDSRNLGIYRSILICLLGGWLTACAVPQGGEPTRLQVASLQPLAVTAPRFTATAFVAEDGAKLPLRVWRPDGPPRAIILALHGFNDYSHAFAGPAAEFARHGIETFAYVQRGFGAAPGRGRWVGARRMAADAALAARLLRRRHPDVPIYLLGESMGAAVAIVTMTGAAGVAPPPVDGVILAAPAVWGRQEMTWFERAGLWLASLMPALQVSGRDLPITVHPSDNIAMLRALNADPLVIKKTRADTLNGLVDLMGRALAAAPRLTAPALILYGEHDEIVPSAPVERMIRALPAEARAVQRVAFYPNGYHMLLRDRQAAMVIGDIEAWIESRNALLPSGADAEAWAKLGGRAAAVTAER